MEKLLELLRTKRVQSAIVFMVVYLLGKFGIVTNETTTLNALSEVIQALASLWHLYGWVDAFRGHNELA